MLLWQLLLMVLRPDGDPGETTDAQPVERIFIEGKRFVDNDEAGSEGDGRPGVSTTVGEVRCQRG
jgi:hypothetical protein